MVFLFRVSVMKGDNLCRSIVESKYSIEHIFADILDQSFYQKNSCLSEKIQAQMNFLFSDLL